MVIELDIEQCVSKETKPQSMLARTVGLERDGLEGLTSIGESKECQRGC